MKNPKNLRKAERKDCFVPVEGQEDSSFAQIQTVDISRTGLGLISKSRLPVNQTIAVELDLTPEGEPVFAFGQVKWIRSMNGPGYRVGMQFTDFVNGSQSRFTKFFAKS